MRFFHPDLAIRTRRADPTTRAFCEALIVERNADDSLRAHIRKTQSDWADNDLGLTHVDGGGSAAFTRYPNGDLRLKDTTTTLFSQATQDESNDFTDLDRSPVWEAALIRWGGTDALNSEILRIKLHLNPRRDTGQRRQVVKWRLELWGLAEYDYSEVVSFDGLYVPLCDAVDVEVTTDAAGIVTFDFSGLSSRPQPKALQPVPRSSGTANHPDPTMLVRLFALDKDGDAATNVAWHTWNGNPGPKSSLGKTLWRVRFTEDPSIGFVQVTSTLDVPYLVIETGTYAASAVIEFETNPFNLGGAPTGDVELIGHGATPPGTSITYDVRNDADSGWVAFTQGQFMEVGLGLTATQTRKMRATAFSNAAGTQTPTLKQLGLQAITRTDYSRVVRIQNYEDAFGVPWLAPEINHPTLVFVKDGIRDYQTQIEELLSKNFLRDIRLRVGVKDDALPREKWMEKDVLFIADWKGFPSHVEVYCRSALALLKDLVPPFSAGTNYYPDGDQSVGSWTTLAGGVTNLYQGIDEDPVDELDGVRSGLSPSNQEYIFTYPTPTNLPGRRLFIDVDYGKDASGGEQIDARFRLYQSTTIIMETAWQTDVGPDRVTKSFEVPTEQIGLLTDLPNLRGSVVAHAPSPGTGRRLQVYRSRFRSGGKREVIQVTGTLKAAYDQVINLLAIPANLRGPGVENTTYTVSKKLTGLRERNPNGRDVLAKAELEAITFLAGAALGTSQGQIKVFPVFEPQPIRAIFPATLMTVSGVSAGLEERIPELFSGYNWSEEEEDFKDEWHQEHAASILKLGTFGLGAPKWIDEEIAKWVDTDALVLAVCQRTVNALACGKIIVPFVSVDAYPELEPGDVIALETRDFLGRDPNPIVERALRGKLWVLAVVHRVDFWGRHIWAWLRSPADILSSGDAANRLGFPIPDLYELTPNVSQTGVVTAVFKASKAGSVKYAVSTSSEPTAATVRAAAPQALDGDGILRTGTLATLTASQSLFIAAFAYERGDGTGTESKLATAKITHYEGGVSADGFESARTGYTVSFTITARDADFEQVKLHYRSVTAVSDSYTSPSPTSTSLNNQPYTPAAVVIDRGLTDRIFEWWAEDASGNKSSIQRLAIPAISSADQAAAVTLVTNTTQFVGTCPTQNMEDTCTWTQAAPASWRADVIRCTSGVSCTPNTVIASDQLSPYVTNFRTAVQSGVGGPDLRRYGVRLKNGYGETVEEQYAALGLSTTFDACP